MDDENETERDDAQSVGALLQATRRKCGEDLRDVAEVLRIRYLYLAAIEEGRFEDLPGAPYAVGFIRAYAEHLGLDGDEVIRLYKADNENAPGASELVFPVPISENEIPGGAIFFVAVLVVILAYGGWYVSSSKDGFFPEMVSSAPESLAEQGEKGETPKPDAKDKADGKTDKPADKSPSTTEAFLADLEKQILDNKKTQKNKKPVKKAPAASSKPSQAKKKKAAQKTVKAPPPSKKLIIKTLPPPKKLIVKPLPPPKKLVLPQKAAPKKKTAPKKPPEIKAVEKKVTEPEPKPQTAQAPEVSETTPKSAVSGRVFGAKKGKNRILVRAKKNSWIQIRDDVSKKLLLTRLLRRGDSYRVPNRKGLRLLTSNTEALEILIDGKAAPPLGGSGLARRSVALDVKKLLDGTAVTE